VEWISVEDGLPEDGEHVLGFVGPNRFNDCQTAMFRFSSEVHGYDNEFLMIHDDFLGTVTHWMRIEAPNV
jgi:hypothetical protein